MEAPEIQPRIYTLSDPRLTEEQVAVTFAMTSRSPDPFDVIAERVLEQDRAAEFHERWVLGYGHASVAEHAVLHLAVENISRLACDSLEDNRLASYTEKSSRYQVISRDSYHVPRELDGLPELRQAYRDACTALFNAYHDTLKRVIAHLERQEEPGPEETETAWKLRLRRIATDSCRALLPAATLTNVGMTANARTMEHAISKLLSSETLEEQDLGRRLLEAGRDTTPTLIKYAAPKEHICRSREARRAMSLRPLQSSDGTTPEPGATLLEWDPKAPAILAATLLYRDSSLPYARLQEVIDRIPREEVERIIYAALEGLGDHDAPPRELENITYLLELVMDYGAFREFRRHRMQTSLGQAPGTHEGYTVPELVREAGQETPFREAVQRAQEVHGRILEASPQAAPYVLTHAHHRRVLVQLNLRQCYHLLKLRTSPQAHWAIRGPMRQALEQLRQVHPALFGHIRLRD